jgi:dihydropteroate synthase
MQHNYFAREFTVNCRGRILDLSAPKVMGILNITPDSFYDGGKFIEEKQIVRQVKKMLLEGAAIIDIGAVSSRPGAKMINERTELQRLLPALKLLVKEFPDTIFSVDTYRSSVAQKAVGAGASLINDISGGSFDKKMFGVVGEMQVPYVLMHIQGNPQTMQQNPAYKNVVKELLDFFERKIFELRKAGVNDIIIDPGFGFGKTVDHNFEILKNLSLFQMLSCTILAGISRKSMINKILKTSPQNALNGTTVLHTIALMNGANILRAHDVKEAVETIKLFNYYSK